MSCCCPARQTLPGAAALAGFPLKLSVSQLSSGAVSGLSARNCSFAEDHSQLPSTGSLYLGFLVDVPHEGQGVVGQLLDVLHRVEVLLAVSWKAVEEQFILGLKLVTLPRPPTPKILPLADSQAKRSPGMC